MNNNSINSMMSGVTESTSARMTAPIAQIARFDAWNNLPGGFEMAYIPSDNDYLKWSLTNDYKPGKYDVPYVNGINGPLYGRNVIPVPPMNNTFQCTPYAKQ